MSERDNLNAAANGVIVEAMRRCLVAIDTDQPIGSLSEREFLTFPHPDYEPLWRQIRRVRDELQGFRAKQSKAATPAEAQLENSHGDAPSSDQGRGV